MQATDNKYIIPTVIPESYEDIASRVNKVRTVAPRMQIDVMDGSYTKTVTWPYSGADRAILETLRKEDQGLPYWQDVAYEVDMLLMRPEDRMEEWILSGAVCLVVHVETTTNLPSIFERAFEARVELALALKPSTDVGLIADYVDRVLFVQCMGNDRVGYHGVPLDPTVYAKIESMHTRWPELTIGVDIGVNEETISALVAAGATRFAVGSAVFEHAEPSVAVEQLMAHVHSSL